MKILFVDDDENIRILAKIAFRQHDVTILGSLDELKALDTSSTFDLIISDFYLHECDAYDIIEYCWNNFDKDIPAIIWTAYNLDLVKKNRTTRNVVLLSKNMTLSSVLEIAEKVLLS